MAAFARRDTRRDCSTPCRLRLGRFLSRLRLRSDPGLKDYAALYWIDEGSTDILIRNAEKIVDILTSHKLHTPKGGGPVRVV